MSVSTSVREDTWLLRKLRALSWHDVSFLRAQKEDARPLSHAALWPWEGEAIFKMAANESQAAALMELRKLEADGFALSSVGFTRDIHGKPMMKLKVQANNDAHGHFVSGYETSLQDAYTANDRFADYLVNQAKWAEGIEDPVQFEATAGGTAYTSLSDRLQRQEIADRKMRADQLKKEIAPAIMEPPPSRPLETNTEEESWALRQLRMLTWRPVGGQNPAYPWEGQISYMLDGSRSHNDMLKELCAFEPNGFHLRQLGFHLNAADKPMLKLWVQASDEAYQGYISNRTRSDQEFYDHHDQFLAHYEAWASAEADAALKEQLKASPQRRAFLTLAEQAKVAVFADTQEKRFGSDWRNGVAKPGEPTVTVDDVINDLSDKTRQYLKFHQHRRAQIDGSGWRARLERDGEAEYPDMALPD